MNNFVNHSPYLRTSREFPEDDPNELSVEINKSYVDIAQTVNARTIGLFPSTRPAISGESWFLEGNQRQQGIRQSYPFTGPITGLYSFPHNINTADISQFVRIWGTFFAIGAGSSSFYYPLPYVDVLAADNQVSLYVGLTKIFISVGTGFTPVIQFGQVTLEWISEP